MGAVIVAISESEPPSLIGIEAASEERQEDRNV